MPQPPPLRSRNPHPPSANDHHARRRGDPGASTAARSNCNRPHRTTIAGTTVTGSMSMHMIRRRRRGAPVGPTMRMNHNHTAAASSSSSSSSSLARRRTAAAAYTLTHTTNGYDDNNSDSDDNDENSSSSDDDASIRSDTNTSNDAAATAANRSGSHKRSRNNSNNKTINEEKEKDDDDDPMLKSIYGTKKKKKASSQTAGPRANAASWFTVENVTGPDGFIRLQGDLAQRMQSVLDRNRTSHSSSCSTTIMTTAQAATYALHLVEAYKFMCFQWAPALAMEDVLLKIEKLSSKKPVKEYVEQHMRPQIRNRHVESVFGRERAERLVHELADALRLEPSQQPYPMDPDDENSPSLQPPYHIPNRTTPRPTDPQTTMVEEDNEHEHEATFGEDTHRKPTPTTTEEIPPAGIVQPPSPPEQRHQRSPSEVVTAGRSRRLVFEDESDHDKEEEKESVDHHQDESEFNPSLNRAIEEDRFFTRPDIDDRATHDNTADSYYYGCDDLVDLDLGVVEGGVSQRTNTTGSSSSSETATIMIPSSTTQLTALTQFTNENNNNDQDDETATIIPSSSALTAMTQFNDDDDDDAYYDAAQEQEEFRGDHNERQDQIDG